jgi:hypothetical protein
LLFGVFEVLSNRFFKLRFDDHNFQAKRAMSFDYTSQFVNPSWQMPESMIVSVIVVAVTKRTIRERAIPEGMVLWIIDVTRNGVQCEQLRGGLRQFQRNFARTGGRQRRQQ